MRGIRQAGLAAGPDDVRSSVGWASPIARPGCSDRRAVVCQRWAMPTLPTGHRCHQHEREAQFSRTAETKQDPKTAFLGRIQQLDSADGPDSARTGVGWASPTARLECSVWSGVERHKVGNAHPTDRSSTAQKRTGRVVQLNRLLEAASQFCQLPTANCQLPTANCQLPTAFTKA